MHELMGPRSREMMMMMVEELPMMLDHMLRRFAHPPSVDPESDGDKEE